MRSRNIKPGFFRNEDIAELDPQTALFFIGLWCYADYRGNFEIRPKKLRAEIFPYHSGFDPVPALDELRKWSFLVYYADDSGKLYAHIQNFDKHQSPHKKEREAGSEVLEFTEELLFPGSVREWSRSSMDPSALIPDSGFPISDVLIPDSSCSQQADSQVDDFPINPVTIFSFPTKDGEMWHLTQELYDELQGTYGYKFTGSGFDHCLNEARSWCVSNRSKRKTQRGMPKFLNGWFSRQEATDSSGEKIYSPDKIEEIRQIPEDQLTVDQKKALGWQHFPGSGWIKPS